MPALRPREVDMRVLLAGELNEARLLSAAFFIRIVAMRMAASTRQEMRYPTASPGGGRGGGEVCQHHAAPKTSPAKEGLDKNVTVVPNCM